MIKLLYIVGIPGNKESWRRVVQGDDIDPVNVIRTYWINRVQAGDTEAYDFEQWTNESAKIIDVDLYDNNTELLPWYKDIPGTK